MRKREELTNPASCMSRAREDEMTFVLLGRDAAAPLAIRAWVAYRIQLKKNQHSDAQILEALACADAMEKALVKAESSLNLQPGAGPRGQSNEGKTPAPGPAKEAE